MVKLHCGSFLLALQSVIAHNDFIDNHLIYLEFISRLIKCAGACITISHARQSPLSWADDVISITQYEAQIVPNVFYMGKIWDFAGHPTQFLCCLNKRQCQPSHFKLKTKLLCEDVEHAASISGVLRRFCCLCNMPDTLNKFCSRY